MNKLLLIALMLITSVAYAYTPSNGKYGYTVRVTGCSSMGEDTAAKRAICKLTMGETGQGTYTISPGMVVDKMNGEVAVYDEQHNGTHFFNGNVMGMRYKSNLRFVSNSEAEERAMLYVDSDNEPDIFITSSIRYWNE